MATNDSNSPVPYRLIGPDEAMALVQARAPSLSPDFLADEYRNEDGETVIRLYSGDTRFEPNFAVEEDTVLVDGNLSVTGLLSDCGDADHTLLVVLGDVTAGHLFLQGEAH